jgi:hypothetical protein
VYLLDFQAYINEMHGSRSKIPSKISRPCTYDVKFLVLLGAPYINDIRLRVILYAKHEGDPMKAEKIGRICSTFWVQEKCMYRILVGKPEVNRRLG